MTVICDCGEMYLSPDEIFACAADRHRRAFLRHAREALDSVPSAFRGDDFHVAMAELQKLERLEPPRPPDAQDVIDLVVALEREVSHRTAESGHRPGQLILGSEAAARLRRVSVAFPEIFRWTVDPYPRPASIVPPGLTWIGSFWGIDLLEAEDGILSRP